MRVLLLLNILAVMTALGVGEDGVEAPVAVAVPEEDSPSVTRAPRSPYFHSGWRDSSPDYFNPPGYRSRAPAAPVYYDYAAPLYNDNNFDGRSAPAHKRMQLTFVQDVIHHQPGQDHDKFQYSDYKDKFKKDKVESFSSDAESEEEVEEDESEEETLSSSVTERADLNNMDFMGRSMMRDNYLRPNHQVANVTLWINNLTPTSENPVLEILGPKVFSINATWIDVIKKFEIPIEYHYPDQFQVESVEKKELALFPDRIGDMMQNYSENAVTVRLIHIMTGPYKKSEFGEAVPVVITRESGDTEPVTEIIEQAIPSIMPTTKPTTPKPKQTPPKSKATTLKPTTTNPTPKSVNVRVNGVEGNVNVNVQFD